MTDPKIVYTGTEPDEAPYAMQKYVPNDFVDIQIATAKRFPRNIAAVKV